MAARKRHDPESKPADGRRSFDRISNKDPRRHYVLASPHDSDTGVDFYVSALGYDIERHRADGPRANVKSAQEGDEVRSGGLVLVSCPIEEHELRVAEGQLLPDKIDRRILKSGNIDDGLRGRGFEMGVDGRETAPFVRDSNGA